MGGGVANIVGAELINGECNGNENNDYMEIVCRFQNKTGGQNV